MRGFLRETFGLGRSGDELARHDPLEGTNATIWDSGYGAAFSVADFWTQTYGATGSFMSPSTAEKVWVANRCMQLNAQQIASMPLRFHGPESSSDPAWVSDPDPTWYPNGISDAVFAIVHSLYAWGYALVFVTERYASTGYPNGWTVIDPGEIEIDVFNGRRRYKVQSSGRLLNPFDVLQIDRNPGFGVHGLPAISAYASQGWGLLAGSDMNRSVLQGGVPIYGLQSKRRVNPTQAEAIQARWVQRTSARGGAPPIIPPELAPVQLGLTPSELLLIEGLGFNARVIASAYGVPPFLLNLPLEGGLTYQNPEKLGEFWWRFELRPTAKRIADAFSKQLLPRGNWVVFDASDTFAPISTENVPGSGETSEEDDPQLAGLEPAATANATPTPTPTPAQNGKVGA